MIIYLMIVYELRPCNFRSFLTPRGGIRAYGECFGTHKVATQWYQIIYSLFIAIQDFLINTSVEGTDF